MRVGFVGWRGMVGSVLLDRMRTENDFKGADFTFFTTSNVGGEGPAEANGAPLEDAMDLEELKSVDVIITCQGGDYTKNIYPALKNMNWPGYWIDAASTLRMDNDTTIVLDPINREAIDSALDRGVKSFAGGNCTVSLMLMGLGGLFKEGLVEWVSSMTYQAASGAGANNMAELVAQMAHLVEGSREFLSEARVPAIELEKKICEMMNSAEFPVENFGHPLACSLLPWIDTKMENGQSREEWKGLSETNKILETSTLIPVDGICVRVSSLRCHSQAFTIKLNKDVPLDEIYAMIGEANDWVKVIANEKEDTLRDLTPTAVSGTLQVPVGRIRKMNMGLDYLGAFSVGDQLLWGAAEPLRRMLKILKERG